MLNECHIGDVRTVLRQMIAAGLKVNCIVTSPPYWGLRSYLPAGHDDKGLELGSEPTIHEFIRNMVEVFMLAREVLADDGTCWINMGDCYATGAGKVNTARGGGTQGERWAGIRGDDKLPGIGPMTQPNRMPQPGLKPKDLVGQPWRLAFALQDAGWWLRQDIIWHKPNPMPESVRDRCTKAHEYLFLLTKSERYHWDFDAMQEPVNGGAHPRRPSNGVGFGHGYDPVTKPRQTWKTPDGWDNSKGDGGHGSFHKAGREKGQYTEVGQRVGPPGNPAPKAKLPGNVNPPKGQQAYEDGDEKHRTKGGLLALARKLAEAGRGVKNNDSMDAALAHMPSTRNRRSVWTVATEPYSGSHFATFPSALIEPCILAGCRPGGIVLDPFMGSGTTAMVAQRLGRQWIGIDIDARNLALQAERIGAQQALVLEAA